MLDVEIAYSPGTRVEWLSFSNALYGALREMFCLSALGLDAVDNVVDIEFHERSLMDWPLADIKVTITVYANPDRLGMAQVIRGAIEEVTGDYSVYVSIRLPQCQGSSSH